MEFSMDHLVIIYRETFSARGSWYNFGLALKVTVATLDSIASCSRDPKDQLRDMLKAWLKTARKPTWQAIVNALDNPIVEEARLAGVIETKYCTTVTSALQKEPHIDVQLLQQQVIANTEAVAEFKEGLLEKEHTLEDLQETVAARNFQIQELQQQASKEKTELDDTVLAQGMRIQEVLEKVSEKQQEEVRPEYKSVMAGFKLRWWIEKKAPEPMTRGVSVVNDSIAYFSPSWSTNVYSYDSDEKVCSNLPECFQKDFSLAIVNGLLTTIGGTIGIDEDPTNSLFSLMGEDQDRKWTEHFPPMPTKRTCTAAVCTAKTLVIIGGGEKSGNALNTVEVMNTDTLQCSIACSLPDQVYKPSATILGDRLYLLGAYIGMTRSVLTCSLPNLLQSCQSHIHPSAKTIWQKAPDVPVYHSTCAALNGHLVAVGGKDLHLHNTRNVYILNPTTNSWEAISHMPSPRSYCLVVVLPSNELMVVGGYCAVLWPIRGCAEVEIAEVV